MIRSIPASWSRNQGSRHAAQRLFAATAPPHQGFTGRVFPAGWQTRKSSMASIKRTASAAWSGPGKTGTGSVSTQSGRLKDTPYSFSTRFENGPGTNPEELIAAAHAGCFTMALAFQLDAAGHSAEKLATEAKVSIEPEGGGFTIKSVHLSLHGKVPGMTAEQFATAAAAAKTGCPVSKVLNAEITLDAKLDS
jgi:osmotically inducible protein OsmC